MTVLSLLNWCGAIKGVSAVLAKVPAPISTASDSHEVSNRRTKVSGIPHVKEMD